MGLQPFVDSYHALEFEVEVIEWPVEGSIVEFRRLTSGRQGLRLSAAWTALFVATMTRCVAWTTSIRLHVFQGT